MLYTSIRFGVVLWVLALAFHISAAHFQKNDESRNANITQESNEPINYRLPNDTKPETYHISLQTDISEGRFDYNGYICINILIVNATRAVTIHARDLNIISIRLSNGSSVISLMPWRRNTKTDFLTIPTKSVEMLPGDRYRLEVIFDGRLRTDLRGFFRTLSDPHKDGR